jgi:hypothetical protein
VGLAIVLGGSAIIGWFARDRLCAEYFVYRLTHAENSDVQRWVADASNWGSQVEPRLLDSLTRTDAATCERAGSALVALHSDAERTHVLRALAERCDQFSEEGQAWALRQAATWVETTTEDLPTAHRQLLLCGLKHASPEVRIRAIGLAIQSHETALELVAALIDDTDAGVRRAAIAALGPHRNVLSDDDLLPRLHDPDRDVQRMAQLALRSRGLTERQVHFGRLLTDQRPSARLELIGMLPDDSELDLSRWLLRLSKDPSPAVRVAAVRTAAELQLFQLSERIEQIAQTDPDATVSAIARFLLEQRSKGH